MDSSSEAWTLNCPSGTVVGAVATAEIRRRGSMWRSTRWRLEGLGAVGRSARRTRGTRRCGHKDYRNAASEKLGITAGSRLALVGPPEGFERTLGELPPGVTILTPPRRCPRRRGRVRDSRGGAHPPLSAARPARWPLLDGQPVGRMAEEGVEGGDRTRVQWCSGWASRPDSSTTSPASIDDIFQAMRFVYRLKDRPGRARPRRG